jgi:chlorinating enzyme
MAREPALNREERAAYVQRGYHFPVTAFAESEVAPLQRKFIEYWQCHQQVLQALQPRERVAYLIDTHLFLRWVYEIAVAPRVLDAVEAVLGPDILLWSSQWFPKLPRDRAFVSWHQDATYWGLSPPNVATAWIALSASDTSNGCLRVVPGTHSGELLPQRETFGADNMLSRGQEIAVTVDETAAVDLVLRPGQLSLHHVGIVHGSGPNESDGPRLGLAVRYISPDVTQQGAQRDIAVLARGRDRYGHFDLVEPPESDLPYGTSATHRESLARKRSNLGK